MTYRAFFLLFLGLLFVASPPSWAENDGNEKNASFTKTYEGLQQEIIRLKEADRVRDLAMKNLIRRIEKLERSALDAQQSSEQLSGSLAADDKQKDLAPEVKQRMRQESEDNYQLIQKAFEQRLVRDAGMLLPPFQMTYEPSLSYAHASYDSIVIDGFTVYPILVIGDIVAEKVRRDLIINSHTFRLGLPWDMQFDLVVPFGYERKRSFRDDGNYVSNESSGLGDISLGLSYQLISTSSFWPDTVVGASWKSKSGDDPYRQDNADVLSFGSGFETWGVSLTSMTISDPVVIYGGMSATYTPESNKKIGHVRPGKSFGANLGMVLSLNHDTSISFNYNYNYTLETEVNNQEIKGSDFTTSTFGVGLSRAGNDFYAMDFDLAIGLTRDSTDFQFTVSLPFQFSLLDLSH
jgi:hypothetical protein